MNFIAISLLLGIAACSPVSTQPEELATPCILKEVESVGTCLFAQGNESLLDAAEAAFENIEDGHEIGDLGSFMLAFAESCSQTYDGGYDYDTCQSDAISTVLENTAYYAHTLGADVADATCKAFLTSNRANFIDALQAIEQGRGNVCLPSQ
ncbi:hypothetical protein N7451_011381 [Penicillium sp. IBT 35674x]|nr:hypothetical protein N7451_011381 [Penicillium sp. IBT 35674x]